MKLGHQPKLGIKESVETADNVEGLSMALIKSQIKWIRNLLAVAVVLGGLGLPIPAKAEQHNGHNHQHQTDSGEPLRYVGGGLKLGLGGHWETPEGYQWAFAPVGAHAHFDFDFYKSNLFEGRSRAASLGLGIDWDLLRLLGIDVGELEDELKLMAGLHLHMHFTGEELIPLDVGMKIALKLWHVSAEFGYDEPEGKNDEGLSPHWRVALSGRYEKNDRVVVAVGLGYLQGDNELWHSPEKVLSLTATTQVSDWPLHLGGQISGDLESISDGGMNTRFNLVVNFDFGHSHSEDHGHVHEQDDGHEHGGGPEHHDGHGHDETRRYQEGALRPAAIHQTRLLTR